MTRKTRKPEYMHLNNESELEQLVPGDLITMEDIPIYSPFSDTIHAVYEGFLKTNCKKLTGVRETDLNARSSCHAFLNLDMFIYEEMKLKENYKRRELPIKDLPILISYRLIDKEIGDSIEINWNIKIFSGNWYPKRYYYPNQDPEPFIQEKLRLLRIGERLAKKLYTFDKVVYVDQYNRSVREVKNKSLYPENVL